MNTQTPTALGRLLRGGLLTTAFSFVHPTGFAATYYLDPVAGNIANPGTAASPWPSAQTVFATPALRGQIQPGDVLLLRDGYHGKPVVQGQHSPTNRITIQPEPGASPKLQKLELRGAIGWTISGLDICPENAGAGQYDKTGHLVWVYHNSTWQPGASGHITIKNNTIRAVTDISGYTVQNWYDRVGSGVMIEAPDVELIDNHIENTNFAIAVRHSAPRARVAGNFVKAFYGDGIRGLSDDSVYEYNWVQDSYVADANHDDFFQSWTGGYGSVPVGTQTVYRVTLRGNIFISRTDPAQPLHSAPQGIALFDGHFSDWLIENNVIITEHYHGVAVYGGFNNRVVNNTLVTDPFASAGSNINPWIRFDNHKNGTPGSGNIARNNITNRGILIVGGQAVASHNLQVAPANHASWFINPGAFDFRLRAGAPAVNAGTTTDAPTLDIVGNTRDAAPDVGAYEYRAPHVYEGFDYAPTTTVGTAADSPSDIGLVGTTWSGNNDIVSPGLSHGARPHIGNALQFSANVSTQRRIDVSVFPPEYILTGADDVPRLGKPGTTLWFSFLIRADAADPTGALNAGLNLVGPATGGGVKLSVGDGGSNANWGLSRVPYPTTPSAYSSSPITTGQTDRLVVRVAFVAGSNNDEVDLFVNPAPGATPPAPSASLRGVDIGVFDTLDFKGNRTSTVDELLIVTDWADL